MLHLDAKVILMKQTHRFGLKCKPSSFPSGITMASHRSANFPDIPYTDPNPLPSSVPHVDELGVTSAPLKSASFFIGEHCKDVNGETNVHLCVVFDAHIPPGRGLYALQARKPGSSALLERGTSGDTMCN